jgi:hypothetical protein
MTIYDVSPVLSNSAGARQGPSGLVTAIAASVSGRVYAATWGGGLWRSDDNGAHWRQIISAQTGDAPATPCASTDATRLPATVIESVAVSPTDPDLVFVGTTFDREDCNGIYRSADGGGTWHRVFQQKTSACPGGSANGYGGPHESDKPTNNRYEPISDISFAPDDNSRLWAAAGCVVAYSTTGRTSPGGPPPTTTAASSGIGVNWRTSTGPMPKVTHLAVGSYNEHLNAGTGGRMVWACAPGNQLWWQTFGGGPDPQFPGAGAVYVTQPASVGFLCASDGVYGSDSGGGQLVADDSDPSQPAVYLVDTNAVNQTVFAYPADPHYQPCSSPCSAHGLVRFSINASGSAMPPQQLSGPPRLPDAYGSGSNAVYGLRSRQGLTLIVANDEDVFAAAAPPSSQASWHRLTGSDAGTGCSLTTVPPSCTPITGGWYPHDSVNNPLHGDFRALAVAPGAGLTVGQPAGMSSPLGSCTPPGQNTTGPAGGNVATLFVGNDGGIAVTPDCGVHWNYGDLPNLPANELTGLTRPNRYPALYFGGRDDGAWYSADGGTSWHVPVGGCGDCTGFYTNSADPNTVAMVFRMNYNNDGYQACCRWLIWQGTADAYPIAAGTAQKYDFELTPHAAWPRMSTDRGWTPLIQSLPTDPTPTKLSIALIKQNLFGLQIHRVDADLNSTGSQPRTNDQLVGGQFEPSSTATSPALQNITPTIVQTSGGINATTFYAAGTVGVIPPGPAFTNAETDAVYKADAPSYAWRCIVPSGHDSADRCTDPTSGSVCPADQACHAYKLAVDPYQPTGHQLIYIADRDGAIKESLNSGQTWFTNQQLTSWLTDSASSPTTTSMASPSTPPRARLVNAPNCQWYCQWGDSDEELHKMLFVPGEPGTAFAAGITGIYMTLDAGCALTPTAGNCSGRHGEQWHRILDSSATPCQPTSMFFDPDEPDGRALYIACNQRGILKILGIPTPADRSRLDAQPLSITFHAPSRALPTGFPRQMEGPLPGDGPEPDGPGKEPAALATTVVEPALTPTRSPTSTQLNKP